MVSTIKLSRRARSRNWQWKRLHAFRHVCVVNTIFSSKPPRQIFTLTENIYIFDNGRRHGLFAAWITNTRILAFGVFGKIGANRRVGLVGDIRACIIDRRVFHHKMRVSPLHPLESCRYAPLIVFHGDALVSHKGSCHVVKICVLAFVDDHLVLATTRTMPPWNVSLHGRLCLYLVAVRIHSPRIVEGKPHIASRRQSTVFCTRFPF